MVNFSHFLLQLYHISGRYSPLFWKCVNLLCCNIHWNNLCMMSWASWEKECSPGRSRCVTDCKIEKTCTYMTYNAFPVYRIDSNRSTHSNRITGSLFLSQNWCSLIDSHNDLRNNQACNLIKCGGNLNVINWEYFKSHVTFLIFEIF